MSKVNNKRLLKFSSANNLSDEGFKEMLSILNDAKSEGIDLGKESDTDSQKVADVINAGTKQIVEQQNTEK